MSVKGIKNIIAIASGKGGVGKSTVAANLAYSLSDKGFKVGLLDADIYGPSQPGLMGNQAHPSGKDGLIIPLEKKGIKFISIGSITERDKPLIMRAPMAVKAVTQFLNGVLWGELDHLIIDLPPGTGDIQLSIAQQIRLTGVLIVTTPQKMASDIARKGLLMFSTLNTPILGVVENMSGFTCVHCQGVTAPFSKGGGRLMAQELSVPFLGEIPLDPAIMLSADEGLELHDYDPHTAHARQHFDTTADNLLSEIKSSELKQNHLEPEKIQHDERNIRILWKDGTCTELDAYTLRNHCKCALCVDEASGKKLLRQEDIPLSIKAQAVRPVGRYGVIVDFSDGHNQGIYLFKNLKELGLISTTESLEL